MVFLRALERPSSTGEGQPAIPNNNTPGQERVISADDLTPMNPLIRKKGAISLWGVELSGSQLLQTSHL